jgi:hypothetical protein
MGVKIQKPGGRSTVQTSRHRYGVDTGKCGLGGLMSGCLAERSNTYQVGSFEASRRQWIKIQPQEQVMRIARLRPWPFSSTTVALASCRSDHFPKRRLYISDVRESDLPHGPGSHPFSKCLWPTLRFAFLAPEGWRLLAAGAEGRRWLARLEGITVPCSDAGTLATTRHSQWGRPRHGSSGYRQLGTAMFHLWRPLRATVQRTDDQRGEGPWAAREGVASRAAP